MGSQGHGLCLFILPEDCRRNPRNSACRFRHGALGGPCEVLDGTPETCWPPHPPGRGTLCFVIWEEEEEEGRLGEAHFAAVSPDVLPATRATAGTCTLSHNNGGHRELRRHP